MEWFEYLIIVIAISLVVTPIIIHFVQKKNGTLKCECGHYVKECVGNCSICKDAKKIIKDTPKLKTHNKTTYTYLIEVKGMKCGMCESHINDALRNSFVCLKVKSNKSKNLMILKVNSLISFEKIKNVISNLGYDVGKIILK